METVFEEEQAGHETESQLPRAKGNKRLPKNQGRKIIKNYVENYVIKSINFYTQNSCGLIQHTLVYCCIDQNSHMHLRDESQCVDRTVFLSCGSRVQSIPLTLQLLKDSFSGIHFHLQNQHW